MTEPARLLRRQVGYVDPRGHQGPQVVGIQLDGDRPQYRAHAAIVFEKIEPCRGDLGVLQLRIAIYQDAGDELELVEIDEVRLEMQAIPNERTLQRRVSRVELPTLAQHFELQSAIHLPHEPRPPRACCRRR